jgi:putative ATP-dependent endonuclease of the OLD family
MYLNRYCLRNFRRLEDVEISLEDKETIFVGANNSGKTSATEAFRLFVSRLRSFQIHDFSSPLISKFDRFGEMDIQENETYGEDLPFIELDLWFTVSPTTEYGRVADFLPSLELEYTEVGVRIRFAVKDPVNLYKAYHSAYPKGTRHYSEQQQKTLSYFLSQGNNLREHYSLKYYKLEKLTSSPDIDIILHAMKEIEGQNTLKKLLRVDYVEAQRNINERESSRSTCLSSVFSDFYKHNLKKQENDTKSVSIIDESNENLTKHYKEQFKSLIDIISNLGFPTLNDRVLRIISSLNPEQALSGSTTLTYFEESTKHQLPEAYNGLGFKNLIYMAIQIAHYLIQWIDTEQDRPFCQAIFIEEPEVHLHAQVQQTFIRQIRKVIEEMANFKLTKQSLEDLRQEGIPDNVLENLTHLEEQQFPSNDTFLNAVKEKIGEEPTIRYEELILKYAKTTIKGLSSLEYTTQLVVTTHSSHIVAESNFQPIRYFRRIKTKYPCDSNNSLHIATTVLNLARFNQQSNEPENLSFLKRYMELTHCDLFFADAAILVEGTVERLLMPRMIKNEAPELTAKYLTILEVGGAYAHRFVSLLNFINLPTLIITDLDSIDPTKKREACRADIIGAVTSNASIKALLIEQKIPQDDKERLKKAQLVSSLMKLSQSDKKICTDACNGYVTFQQAISVPDYGSERKMIPRTFEEAFIYENISAVRNGTIDALMTLPSELNYEADYTSVFEAVNSSRYKKVEFALKQIDTDEEWVTPAYIVDGLKWLSQELKLIPHVNV